jgi:peptidoglycan/xylan/chitin deacetylase (PgdA/CDA1 family)
MRRALKRYARVTFSMLPGLLRHLRPRSLVILAYHRILPSYHPDLDSMQPGMVVHPETFRKQLVWLKQLFDIVDLSVWLREKRTFSRTACAITFDDGWRDTFEFAYPILEEQQVPATVFVVSDVVGTNESFWPERLARMLWSYACASSEKNREKLRPLLGLGIPQSLLNQRPDRANLDKIIEIAKRHPDEILLSTVTALEAKLGIAEHNNSRDILTWEETKEMRQSGLVSIGSHGKHHLRLSKVLDKEALENEIAGSKDAIETKLGAGIEVFCYPGGDVSPSAEQLVRSHYRAACTTHQGWNSPRADCFRLKRISMHEDVGSDVVSFFARVSGWL